MNKQTPFVVGLTGGIGSGKSAATDIFASFGIDIVDADEVARDVVAVGSQGLLQIAEHFGEHILGLFGIPTAASQSIFLKG